MKKTVTKINPYQMVTDRIIEELKKGEIPWIKPWVGGPDGAYSRSTGKPYSLLNQMLLKNTGEYMTFNQCKEAGGTVRKGEKSEIVVFYKPFMVKETDSFGKEVEKTVPYLRYYNVFHISQCEGITPIREVPEMKPIGTIETADMIVRQYQEREGVSISHVHGNKAYYRPATDSITMPLKEQFDSSEEYYSTLFHEAIHSTGHESRLNRIAKNSKFGNEEYSKEELVAEIGAASILNQLGIETAGSFKNSAAYIQNWIKLLSNDSKLFTSAAGQAEKAGRLVMGQMMEEANAEEAVLSA